MADLRTCSLIPGRKVQVQWPGWGWWNAIIDEHNPENGKITVLADYWSEERREFDLADLREGAAVDGRERKALLPRAALLRCSLLAGGAGLLLGLLLERLLPWLLPFLRLQ